MAYLALATDYDGTIATEGVVETATLDALQRWRNTGRKLILITGRELDDWLSIFEQPSLFDWVVAENGAVLYHPERQDVKLLSDPPPAEFVEALRNRVGTGAEIAQASGEFAKYIEAGRLFSMGRIIVATWQPYDQTATELIQEMGLDLQVIMNKRAVMVLPRGIDKAFGLRAAAEEIGVTPDQIIGVGDAENDLHFLELCGYSVAVANALPSVKQQVNWVTAATRGAGVTELIEQLIDHQMLVQLEGE
jgi:HAD superfamily hydrolase (TIGR01484 family)